MIIKAKYPKTERWYMNIESQGYGSGTQSNVSNVSQSNTSSSSSVVNSSIWNSVDQSSGTTTNENSERVINPITPVAPYGELVLVTLVDGEYDNRGAGVNYSYLDINGVTQTGYIAGDSSLEGIVMKESDLGTVTSTDGAPLIAFHGGRYVISQLTNTNPVVTRNPEYRDGLNDGILSTSIGSIAPLATWNGEIVVLGVASSQFAGNLSINKLYQASGDITIDTEVVDLAGGEFYRNF